MQDQKTGPNHDPFYQDRLVRHFFNFFKSRKQQNKIRPGALSAEELKKNVQAIGKGKKVNILRVQYDGTPEEHPTTVKLLAIRDEYFTGETVNVERSIKQEMDERIAYVKGGGGSIDFYYSDGDIISIEEDFDETVIRQMNDTQLLEILDALDLNESIRISYYDKSKGGVMNGTGKLLEKDVPNKTFKVELTLVNDIELDHAKTVSLNLDQIPVLDLEVIL